METIHCTSDAPYVLARLGEKRAEEGAYVWQKLMKSGAVICNGPTRRLKTVNPIPNFYAARLAETQGRIGLLPGAAHVPEEALEIVHPESALMPRLKRASKARSHRASSPTSRSCPRTS